MAASRLDLAGLFAIDRGTTWSMALAFNETADGETAGVAWNLTGYTARLQIAPGRVNDGGVVLNLNTPPVKTLTVGAGITIDALNGGVTLKLTATETRALVAGAVLVYDLRLYSAAGEESRPIFGSVLVREQITPPS